MAHSQFAEIDHCGADGAAALARRIEDFWAGRVTAHAAPVDSHVPDIWRIVSNLGADALPPSQSVAAAAGAGGTDGAAL